MRSALLLGASGLVGRYCLAALLADSAYEKVIIVSRRELPDAMHEKVEQKIMPLESLDSATLPPLDDVFCALGTTIRKAGSQEAFRHVDLEMPLASARAGLRAGAKQLVLVSSVGADPNSKNFYLRTKGEVEQRLQSMSFAALHIFRPSLLLGERGEFRLGEAIAMPLARLLGPVMVGGLRKYRAIDASTVGRAMVAAAGAGENGTFVYEYGQIVRLAAPPGNHAKL